MVTAKTILQKRAELQKLQAEIIMKPVHERTDDEKSILLQALGGLQTLNAIMQDRAVEQKRSEIEKELESADFARFFELKGMLEIINWANNLD